MSGMPLLPDVASELYKVFLAKGVHGTTAIEGNSLTEEQVRLRLSGRLDLPKSQDYLGTEVDNIITAYRWLMDRNLNSEPSALCAADLMQLNGMVLSDVPVGDGVQPGQFRQ